MIRTWIGIAVLCVVSLVDAQPLGDVQQPGAEGDWATVLVDPAAIPGTPYRVTVQLKQVPDGQQLAVDLHFLKRDGKFGGVMGYAPRRAAQSGKTEKYSFKIDPRNDVLKVFATVYLSPDGGWGKRTATLRGPAVPFGKEAAEKAAEAAKNARPSTATMKESWISVQAPAGSITEGEPFEVKVDYYLDPSDNWGDGTKLTIVGHGPWIDNPDGKYTKHRQHIGYRGLRRQTIDAQVGRHTHVFQYKAPKAFKYNSLLLITNFIGGDGKNWSWNVRAGGPIFQRKITHYALESDVPGNLFTYDQAPEFRIAFKEGVTPGEQKALRYTLWNTAGESKTGEYTFTAGEPGTAVTFTPPLESRGTHYLRAEVDGWGEREFVFATIPDLSQVPADQRRVRFGVTNVRSEAESAIAQRLGFSMVRHYVRWYTIQPAEDRWTLDGLDQAIDTNLKYGLQPWIALGDPPAWVQTGQPRNITFAPFAFDEEALERTVMHLAQHLKGRIWGWEWLNEIVPGDVVSDPVQTYLSFVRTATTAAKSVDPDAKVQLAGGLWPRNFRIDLLRAGIGDFIDVLPIHYGNHDGILDAQEDVAAVGKPDIEIWDNETSAGASVWAMPTEEMIRETKQAQWVLQRWPDELTAGARQITVFGGSGDPAGNWSYLLDEKTARPMAVTLAVAIHKLSRAVPLGKIYQDDGAVIHAFEHNGKAVLVASAAGSEPVEAAIDVAADHVIVTDYQGNERTISTPNGRLAITLSSMPVFIENASVVPFKSRLALSIGTSSRPARTAQITAVAGSELAVPLRVANLFDHRMDAEISLLDEGGRVMGQARVALEPGQRRIVEIAASGVQAQPAASANWTARLTFGRDDIPPVERSVRVDWIDPAMLGNLLGNGGFEQAGDGTEQAAGWSLSSGAARIASGGQIGTGDWVVRLGGDGGWVRASQGIGLPPACTYLYSAWVKTDGVRQAGSNITYVHADGTRKELYIPHVFQAPSRTGGWHLLTYKGTTPDNVKEVHFTPIARGGQALLDNVRVTLYDGSDFAAEAVRTAAPPVIDGDLSEWTNSPPLPLLAENQLIDASASYKWTPDNLSGVARFSWDEHALYLSVEVIDDQHIAATTGEQAPEGDCVTLALQPARLGRETNDRAFVYYISAASPGGGSGKFTLYRPPQRSGGFSSGQLAKDSSNYEMGIVREGRSTRYELRLPWSELGGMDPHVGLKLGLSMQLHDNDGQGRSASMIWGEGLQPAWEPSVFGVLTLTD